MVLWADIESDNYLASLQLDCTGDARGGSCDYLNSCVEPNQERSVDKMVSIFYDYQEKGSSRLVLGQNGVQVGVTTTNRARERPRRGGFLLGLSIALDITTGDRHGFGFFGRLRILAFIGPGNSALLGSLVV